MWREAVLAPLALYIASPIPSLTRLPVWRPNLRKCKNMFWNMLIVDRTVYGMMRVGVIGYPFYGHVSQDVGFMAEIYIHNWHINN